MASSHAFSQLHSGETPAPLCLKAAQSTGWTAFPDARWTGWIGCLVLLGALGHGLLFFTDYMLWDGIWEAHHIEMAPVRYDCFERSWFEGGRVYETPYYWPLLGIGNSKPYPKVIGVVSWIAAAAGCFLFLGTLPRVATQTAFGLCCLMLALPLYDVLGDMNSMVYSLPTAYFWWGLYLLRRRREASTITARVTMTAVMLGLLFLSFCLPSNLVLFYGVFALTVALEASGAVLTISSAKTALASAARSNPDSLVLPLIFWTLKKILFPTSGSLVTYNAIHLDPFQILNTYASLLHPLATGEIGQVFTDSWVLPVGIALGAVAVAMRNRLPAGIAERPADIPDAELFLGGCWLVACGTLPYALVGQPMSSHGWLTRNAILLPLPVSMMILAGTRWAARKLVPSVVDASLFVTTTIVAVGLLQTNLGYLRLQALGAKQTALEMTLEPEMVAHRPLAVLQLRDEFPIASTMPWYPPAIWSYLLTPRGQIPQTLVIDTRPFAGDALVQQADGTVARRPPVLEINHTDLEAVIDQTCFAWAFTGVPRDGGQMVAVVRPGNRGTDGVAIGLSYMWAKYFEPAKLNGFLANLVACEIQEGPPIR